MAANVPSMDPVTIIASGSGYIAGIDPVMPDVVTIWNLQQKCHYRICDLLLQRVEEYGTSDLMYPERSRLDQPIASLMYWDNTPEGHDFWSLLEKAAIINISTLYDFYIEYPQWKTEMIDWTKRDLEAGLDQLEKKYKSNIAGIVEALRAHKEKPAAFGGLNMTFPDADNTKKL